MSDRTVTITLTARDGMSKTFTAVARSGEEMRDTLKRSASDVEREFDDLGASTRRTGRGFGELSASARDLGLGLGVALAGLSLAGKSFRDQEIALESMRRGYGDAADEMERFADQLQDTTNFSNDAAIKTENIFRTLAQNYGFTADEIRQLIGISADLAASMGIGLEDAAMRVQSAMRGEAEAAEYLGLTLNDHALGIDRMAASTSEAEKAQVRFAALQEQSAFAMGMAQQQADGTYGSLVDLKDGFQDAAQSAGELLGPFGEIGAFAADNAVQLAALGLAIGQVGKAGSAAVSLLSGGAGLVGLLTGPAGIVVAASAAVGGLYLLHKMIGQDIPQAAEAGAQSMQEFADAIAAANDQTTFGLMIMTLDDIMRQNNQTINDRNDSMAGYLAIIDEIKATWGDVVDDATGLPMSVITDGEPGLRRTADAFRDLTEAQKDQIDISGEGIITAKEMQTWIDAQADAASRAGDANRALMAGMDELQAIWKFSGDGALEFQSAAVALTQGLFDGTVAAEDYEPALRAIVSAYSATGQAASAAGAAAAESAGGFDAQAFAIAKANQSLESYLQNQQLGRDSGPAQEHRETAAAIEKENAARDAANAAMQEYLDLEQQIAGAAGVSLDVDGMETARQNATELTRTFDGLGAALPKADLVGGGLAAMSDQFEEVRTAVMGTTDALEAGFRTAVGNTNSIASQSQAVADWATELINVQGQWGKIDDLLQRGIITQQDYTAAQAAYTPIAEANARIQDAVLEIQTKQAPVLAELAEAQADYMESLADAPADQQMFALAMMDSATSAQALQLATALLGENGDTFAPMVESAANLDPYLASILLQMGLIEETVDESGNKVYKVTADTADAQSQLEQIADAIDRLNQTQLLLVALLDDDPFTNTAADVERKMNSLDGAVATPTVNLNDNASGELQNVAGLLRSLDGATSTSYITTVRQEILQTLNPFANGGVIARAAMGRVIASEATLVGEHGPELLLGGEGRGGLVFPATGTRASLGGGSGAPPVTVHVHGNVYGVEDLAVEIARAMAPAWERATAEHARSVG